MLTGCASSTHQTAQQQLGQQSVLAVNWFVVLPLKGAPVGGGWRLPGVGRPAIALDPLDRERIVGADRVLLTTRADYGDHDYT